VTTVNLADGHSRNPISLGDVLFGVGVLKQDNFRNLRGREFSFKVLSPTVSRSILLVFAGRLPAKMLGIDAAKVSVPAFMRGVMFRGWRRTVYDFAHKPVGAADFAVVTDLPPPGIHDSAERPDQAFDPVVVFIGHYPVIVAFARALASHLIPPASPPVLPRIASCIPLNPP